MCYDAWSYCIGAKKPCYFAAGDSISVHEVSDSVVDSGSCPSVHAVEFGMLLVEVPGSSVSRVGMFVEVI